MSEKCYPEDFKIEAVRQVTDRVYKVSEVASRLSVTVKSLHDWIKKYSGHSKQHQPLSEQQAEIRKLKADLRRVTEEREIPKEVAAYFAGESRKIRVHEGSTPPLLSGRHVPGAW